MNRERRLKFCVRSPIANGIGAAAEHDDPSWPRYVRITDIAGPRKLRGDTFRSLPPEEAAVAPFFVGDILAAAVGATFGKTYLHSEDIGPAVYAGYLVRISPGREFDPRYVAYWSESQHYWDQLNTNVIQSTIQNFSAAKYAELRIPVPSKPNQRAIADFLDCETARLDALIAAKERMLRLLAEKRRALTTRAVIRGLDPDARLRDSGNAWLGEVPAHWKTVPLRFLVDVFGGATPDTANADFWDGDIPWVSPKDMKRDIIDDAEEHVTSAALSASALQMIVPGAVLIVVRGMILAHSFPTAVTTAPVTINQDMKALRCREGLDPYFLRDFFRGIARYIVSLAETSAHGTRKLESRVLGQLEIGVPPLAEQRDIVAYIALQSNKLNDLAFATTKSIDLIKERRAALIAAAVTGQLPISGLSKAVPSEEEVACSSTS